MNLCNNRGKKLGETKKMLNSLVFHKKALKKAAHDMFYAPFSHGTTARI